MSEQPVELTIAGKTSEPGGLRLVATLAIAGVLAGFLLAGVHQVTQPMIQANKVAALERAVLEVVPGATQTQRFVIRDGALVADTTTGPTSEPAVYAAYDADAKFVGYAIRGEGAGFQDTIALLIGFDPTRERVTGMYVLTSRETPGLGDKIFKDPAFGDCFKDLAVEPQVVLVKDGRTEDNQVDAITGATISSRAVVNITNAALDEWRPLLLTADQIPPPAAQSPPAPENADG